MRDPLLDDAATDVSESQRAPVKPLRLYAVVVIVFFNVSGGPLGSEEVVASLGPILGLSLMVVFALLFSIPQAMITAELSTAFPANGGYSLWVQAAFGTFWGVQESYWSWFSGVVDSALYPVLLYETGVKLLSGMGSDALPDSADGSSVCNATVDDPASYSYGDDSGGDGEAGVRNLWGCMFEAGSGCALEYGIKLATLFCFCLPNVISSRVVGDFLTGLCLIAMAPFLVLSAFGLSKWRVANFVRQPRTYKWQTGLSCIYWNLSGFDSASTFAGEVDQPHKTFPRALFLSVGFILAMYLVPLLASAGADGAWDCWEDGSLSAVALLVGGSWLGVWLVASSAMSNWGLFASELLEDSYQLLGMAEMGLAPAIFARRCAATDTPINCIALQFVMIALLISLDFNQILCIDNFFSASAAILEFLACIRLRFSDPELDRPYTIPLGRRALAVALLVPIGWSLLVCYATFMESRESMVVIGVALVVGLLLYAPFYFAAGRGEARTLMSLSRSGSMATQNPVQGALLKQSAQPEALDPLSPPRSPHGSPNRTPRMSRERMSGERPSGERGSAVHGGTGTIE